MSVLELCCSLFHQQLFLLSLLSLTLSFSSRATIHHMNGMPTMAGVPQYTHSMIF